jgi:hypothetical protein
MQFLSQQDNRWAEAYIGSSKLKIGRWGCTLTCLSMLSDFFKAYLRPDIIAAHKSWFTDDSYPYGAGLILWTKLRFPTFKFVERVKGYNPRLIEASIRDPKKAVILEVNHSHWVLALGYDVWGNIRIADPLFGDKATVKRYRSNVTGSAHFVQI